MTLYEKIKALYPEITTTDERIVLAGNIAVL